MRGFRSRSRRGAANTDQRGGAQPPPGTDPRDGAPSLGSGMAEGAAQAIRARKRANREALNFADGGVVRGPGTGTSDSIEDEVEEGSYIMPADSTEQIGEEALSGMGLGMGEMVPVNLSNGEYKLPPEQVHAIGVEALNELRDTTHEPADAPAPEMFFRDGGEVRRPPRSPMFVDSGGTAHQNLPSQSRALVPSSDPASRVYVGPDGGAGRGFMPSQSRELVPSGPRMSGSRAMVPAAAPAPAAPGTALVPVSQPAEGPQQAPREPHRPDYRRRAEAQHRSRRDAAAWQAERAAQDARFAEAAERGNRPRTPGRGFLPRGMGGAGLGLAAAALPEAVDVYDVATDPSTSKLDVATQVAEGAGKTASAGLGVAAGAKVGGAIGAFGGPFAPVTVPVGAGLGALVGGAGGYFLADKAIEKGRELVGGDPQSPVERLERNQPVPSAPVGSPAESPADQPVAAMAPPPQPDQPAAVATPRDNDVVRVGNSFSGQNIREGFTINGEEFQPGAEQSPQNQQAVAALLARTPELGAGQGLAPQAPRTPGGTVAMSGARGFDPERDRLIRAASTPHAGAQNRQLTAAQLNTLRGLRADEGREATALASTAMTQEGALQRAALQESGTDRRFAASHDLNRERFAGEQQVRGFQARAAERLDKLHEQYASASPSERSAIAEEIRNLSGRDAPNRFTVVPGGQVIDPETQQTVTQPAMVFNNQTGEFVPVANQGASAPSRPVGTRSTVNGRTAVWDGSRWIPQ